MGSSQPSSVRTWLESLPDVYSRNPLTQPSASDSVKHNTRNGVHPSRRRPPSEMETRPAAKRVRQELYTESVELDQPRQRSKPSASGFSSRSASPLKQLSYLSVADSGIEIRTLDSFSPPTPAAAELLESLQDVKYGLNILPDQERDRIFRHDYHSKHIGNARVWRSAFRPPGTDEEPLPGRIPSSTVMALIHKRAQKCRNSGYGEAAWNAEVHFRLLESIFRHPETDDVELLDCSVCTTARPYSIYLPRAASNKMIDMCIYADLSANTDDADALRLLGSRTPSGSINHVEFMPLYSHPIVLSIETKRSSGDLNAAQLQMGVWLAAQWRFLRSAVYASLQYKDSLAEAKGKSKQAFDRDDISELSAANSMKRNMQMEEQADRALLQLAFIPGIIVHGHRWFLVISTRNDEKTILWEGLEFGSTASILESYQIVAGIRRLAAWARDVYLLWFRKYVLDTYMPALPEEETTNDENDG